MKTVKVLLLLKVQVPDDVQPTTFDKPSDEVESAFYDPDMDDSITEAINRYTSLEVNATVQDIRVTRRNTLRPGRLA